MLIEPPTEGSLSGMGMGFPVGRKAGSVIERNEGLDDEVLAGDAVEGDKEAVARGLCEQLARFAVDDTIEEDWRGGVVEVVGVVRRDLKVPLQFSSVGVESDDGFGPEICAGPALAGEDGIGVSGGPVEEIELGIVCAGHPRHAAAVF